VHVKAVLRAADEEIMEGTQKEEEVLKALVELLVDDPSSVKIDTTVTAHSAVFDIHVGNSDVGQVLGKRGVHANAMRTLFNAIFGKLGKRLHLQIVDPRSR
tara:strand:+ start:378 stop:680 length:303 start_codon:yes stop_codon:yes gene_type:complete